MSFLIEEIRNNIESRDAYSSYILKDMKILKEAESEVEIFPIVGVEIELEEKEITLLSSELNEAPKKNFKPIPLRELLIKLEEIDLKYKEFELFSGSSIFKLDKDHYGRRDTPLEAFGFDDEDKTFVLIQCESGN